jgi:hypothetical protein
MQGSNLSLLSFLGRCDRPRSPRDHASTSRAESLAFRIVEPAIRAFHNPQSCLRRPIKIPTAIATELLTFRILVPAIRTFQFHFPLSWYFVHLFLLALPFRCLLIRSLTFRFLLLGDLRYEILTPPCRSSVTSLARDSFRPEHERYSSLCTQRPQ